jgi:CheY-like chemotaxis protein
MPLKSRQTPTSVLIVERQPAAAEHLSGLLHGMGFDNVWRARSVAEALRTCKVTPFDVAIIQLDLGKDDGETLITALRGWPGSVDLVVATGLDKGRLRLAASNNLPADAFLLMPLTLSALRKAIGPKIRAIRPRTDDGGPVVVINDEG